MTMTFSYQGSAARIVFGRGTSAEVGKWVETLGCRRVLVLSTPHQAGDAEADRHVVVDAEHVAAQALIYAGIGTSAAGPLLRLNIAKVSHDLESSCLVPSGVGAAAKAGRRQAPLAEPQHACATLWGFPCSHTSGDCKKT